MSLNYRKDIDGLRAIAVLLVVLFHAGFAIPGGFIGVDIFFVISGFLIASAIQKKLLAKEFSFKEFYLNRIRRIMPALLIVIITTFIVSWFILIPMKFILLIKVIIYSLIGFSNIYFEGKGHDYFDPEVDLFQLLHTWSLGVEEQFYFIIPIFLIILFKFFYNTKWFNIILITLLICGIGISQYIAINEPSKAYYLLPARFFELLMGVVLALNYKKLPMFKNSITNNVIALTGILLIMVPAFYITKESLFPGFNALFVCLGACILIYIGKLENKTVISKVLSIKPIVFIGVISYSLYLWHWVVFSTLKIVRLDHSPYEMTPIIIGLIALSYLSWKFIEQPFRFKFKWGFLKTFLILFLIPALIFLAVKIGSKKTDGFYEYRFSNNLMNYAKTSLQSPNKNESICHNDVFISREKDDCTVGNKNEKPSVLFYGDSHASAFAGFVNDMLLDVNRSANIITYDTLLAMKGMASTDYPTAVKTGNARPQIKNTMLEIKNNKYDYVAFTGYYNIYYRDLSPEVFQEKLSNTFEYIINNGATPVMILDVPLMYKNYDCAFYNKSLGLDRNCNVEKNQSLKLNNKMLGIVSFLKNKYKNAIFIDPTKYMCDQTECLSSDEEGLFYVDTSHTTYYAGQYVAKKYLEQNKNPFK